MFSFICATIFQTPALNLLGLTFLKSNLNKNRKVWSKDLLFPDLAKFMAEFIFRPLYANASWFESAYFLVLF